MKIKFIKNSNDDTMPIRPFDLEKMTGHAPDKTQSNTEKNTTEKSISIGKKLITSETFWFCVGYMVSDLIVHFILNKKKKF